DNYLRRTDGYCCIIYLSVHNNLSSLACVRFGDGKRVVELRVAGGCAGHADDLRVEREAVPRDRGRRTRETGLETGRLRNCVYAAVSSSEVQYPVLDAKVAVTSSSSRRPG